MKSRREIAEDHPEMLAEYDAQAHSAWDEAQDRQSERDRVKARQCGDVTDEYTQPIEED